MKQISLYELQLLVENAVHNALNDSYWVVAEISEFKVNSSGHCYLELVEKSVGSQQPKAKARAVIWANKFIAINDYFTKNTSSSLRSGIKVLVCVRVSFHVVYGFSYVIENIDPTYTLGDIAMQRQATILQLKSDGIYDMNRECELPCVVQNIAIVSSSSAAGYQDFMKELHENRFGYKFSTTLFDAVMQGDTAQFSLQDALGRVYDYIGASEFDAVVVIRGGGSISDLSCFDSYEVASVVAQFPIAVLAGIGHDKDISVVDMVANKTLKTPTAVAQYIVDRANVFELYMSKCLEEIAEQSRDAIGCQKVILGRYVSDIFSLSSGAISQTKIAIERLVYRLDMGSQTFFTKEQKRLDSGLVYIINCVERGIEAERVRLDMNRKKIAYSFLEEINQLKFNIELLASGIEQHNPQRIFKMGYSVVKIGGGAVKSVKNIEENSHISIQCIDGKVVGNLINIKNKI